MIITFDKRRSRIAADKIENVPTITITEGRFRQSRAVLQLDDEDVRELRNDLIQMFPGDYRELRDWLNAEIEESEAATMLAAIADAHND